MSVTAGTVLRWRCPRCNYVAETELLLFLRYWASHPAREQES